MKGSTKEDGDDGDVIEQKQLKNNLKRKQNQYFLPKSKLDLSYLLTISAVACIYLIFVPLPTCQALTSHSEWVQTYYKVNDQPAKIMQQETHQNNGYVGCLFSDSVCNQNEFCFNDDLFGRCLNNDFEENSIEKYGLILDLNEDDIALLIGHLKLLMDNGFDWTDTYTQCVIQNALASIESGLPAFEKSCGMFLPEQPEEPLVDDIDKDVDENVEMIPDVLEFEHKKAIVPKKLPVFPTLGENEFKGQKYVESENALLNLEDQKNLWQDAGVPFYFPEDLPIEVLSPENENENDNDGGIFLNPNPNNMPMEKRSIPAVDNYQSTSLPVWPAEYNDVNNFDNFDYDYDLSALSEPNLVPLDYPNEDLIFVDTNENLINANYPDYLVPDSEPALSEDDDNSIVLESAQPDDFEPITSIKSRTGGGLGATIFNRHERLDVKKPGPFFRNSANNFFLNKLLTSSDYEEGYYPPSDTLAMNSNQTNETDAGQIEYEMPLLAPMKDKRLLPVDTETPEEPNAPQYVHIFLKERLDTWKQGSDFIEFLAYEFGLPRHALDDKLIETKHVQFRVLSNPQNIDAEQMSKILTEDVPIRNDIKSQLALNIDKVEAGTRDLESRASEHHSILFSPTSIFSGQANYVIIAVIALSAVVAFCLLTTLLFVLAKRRNRINRKKQQVFEEEKGTTSTSTNDEYKQLCRDWSRSSKKVEAAKSTGTPKNTAKRTLQQKDSKDSEGSSRSSTSSWGEEPNNTNMDISTGHMVLSYMESHLENKQRLEHEWVTINSGYDTSSETTHAAYKAENKKKNRYPDKIPYDNNRIILNRMVNGTSSEYINASAVTDHDPRNVSYVVTQGPLANTVADFWQMIWEQGCVVIVMLTTLQEDSHQLCHRYWPEQGSEQYHIFEVHLVSEHVWNDDYLVRSVYLKNTRSGETRTVTQFHFKSWESNGVPTSTKSLLEFRRKVNKSYRGRSCPICVHCSDGVGRSGTYVLIDMVLSRMARAKQFDIAATLEHIREQRRGMVQSKEQFEFALMAVAEEVHAILRAMPQ